MDEAWTQGVDIGYSVYGGGGLHLFAYELAPRADLARDAALRVLLQAALWDLLRERLDEELRAAGVVQQR